MTDTKYKYDIYLSYSKSDAKSVEKVAHFLSGVGLNIWFDRWSLVPGKSWEIASDEALDSSLAVVVFIGPSPISNFLQQEWQTSLKKLKNGTLQLVIPVMLPGSSWDSVPSYLRVLGGIDLHDGLDNQQELNRLVASIRNMNQSDVITRDIQIGNDLLQAGDSKGALKHYEIALKKAVDVHGESHPIIATILNQIARTQQDMRDDNKYCL